MKYKQPFDLQKLAEKIRKARKDKGLKSQDVARMLNISPGHYANIELGRYPLRVTHLKILTDLYKKDFLHDL